MSHPAPQPSNSLPLVDKKGGLVAVRLHSSSHPFLPVCSAKDVELLVNQLKAFAFQPTLILNSQDRYKNPIFILHSTRESSKLAIICVREWKVQREVHQVLRELYPQAHFKLKSPTVQLPSTNSPTQKRNPL